MAKLKLTVGQEAYEESGVSDIEPPKPGVYNCRVAEINSGYSTDENTKKPDKERPRLEVIYVIVDEKAKTRGNDGGSAFNARLWEYITFGDNVQWKLAQFLKAFGIPYKKVGKNLEFELDTAKIAAQISDADPKTLKAKPAKKTGHDGLPCRVKVKTGSNRDGDYRAEVGSVLPPKEDGDDDDAFADADAETGDDEAMDEEVVEETIEIETHDEDDLKTKSPAELKAIVATLTEAGAEIDIKGKKKSEVITLILEAEAALTAGGEDEEMGDDDEAFEEEDDEIIADDDDSEKYTQEGLTAMEPSDLKEVAKAFDIKFGGKKKSQVITEILEAQGADEGDGENPF